MKIFFFFISLLLALGCNNIEDNPERIEKLRAIGVDTDQANYSFSESGQSPKTATLTFLLLTKDPATVVATPVNDLPYATLSEITQTEVSYSEMRLIQISAKITLPTRETALSLDDDGTGLLLYALKVNQGNEEEYIRSRLRVYPTGDDRLNLSKPSITLAGLQAKAPLASGTIPLQAEITKTQSEPYRVSWFVAEGEIEKRRAEETDWTNVSSGTKTIVATIRGLDSLRIGYTIIDIPVQ